jgi:hypothetical protein
MAAIVQLDFWEMAINVKVIFVFRDNLKHYAVFFIRSITNSNKKSILI